MSKKAQHVKNWRARTKARMVEAMGGDCYACRRIDGPEVFDFHHIDPSTKRFPLGGARSNPTTWVRMAEELRRCVMLCTICHRKVESGTLTLLRPKSTFNEKFATYSIVRTNTRAYGSGRCAHCNTLFDTYSRTHRFCTDGCRHAAGRRIVVSNAVPRLNRRKVERPTKARLAELMESLGWEEIGRTYGVSGNCIKKWARRYGIPFESRRYVKSGLYRNGVRHLRPSAA